MTYNRMAAKPIAGEHCRFCGDASAPLLQTPCCQQWICCDTAFVSFRGGGRCQVEHERLVCAIPTMRINMVALGKAVSNAVISGRPEITKPMQRTRSIGQNIEGQDVNEVQIPGTKIEL